MKREKSNPFDRTLMPACVVTSILYALQFTQIVDLPLWVILLPVIIVCGMIAVIMLVSTIIALLAKHL